MTTPPPTLVERLLTRQCTANQSPPPPTTLSTPDSHSIPAEAPHSTESLQLNPPTTPKPADPGPTDRDSTDRDSTDRDSTDVDSADPSPNNRDLSDWDLSNPGPTHPESSNSDPSGPEPTSADPASLEPANADRSNSEPGGWHPSNTEPANTEPANTEPANAQLANAQLVDFEPADAANPESATSESGPDESGSTGPNSVGPSIACTGNSGPSNLDPTNPGPNNPDPVNLTHNTSDPAAQNSADLKPVDPKPAAPAAPGTDPSRPYLNRLQTNVPETIAPDCTDPSGMAPATATPSPVDRELAGGGTDGNPASRTEFTPSESSHQGPVRSHPVTTEPARSKPDYQQTIGSQSEHIEPRASACPSPNKSDRSEEPAAIRDGSPHRTGHDIRLARAYLMRVAEPPAAALLAFVDAVGPVEAAAAVRAADVPPRVLAETSARRHLELAESDLADAERVGARLVVPEDEEWPAWPLLSLAAACDRGQRWAGSALGLWARGPARLTDTFERAVSVVGARSASGYGEYVATDVGHGLARAGMTVVSGAAYGIDGCAHRGALTADGTTVAVLGCGVDVGYPAGHATLIERIARNGLVLSEYPPGTPPARHRFLVRNRLIAALSSGTVVVEAGIRSGARNTATTAAALGKIVLAVPGPITSAMSAGCHDLLRTGTAMLAGSLSEILEAVGPVGEHLAEPPTGPTRRTDGLAGDALRVHEALRRRAGRTPARIAVESGVPIDRVRALLPELELTGLAEQCEEGWRRTPEP